MSDTQNTEERQDFLRKNSVIWTVVFAFIFRFLFVKGVCSLFYLFLVVFFLDGLEVGYA